MASAHERIQSVEQITRAAQDYPYDPSQPLRKYIRAANTLLQQARIYMQEGDDQYTYLLLFRHAHLVLTHLSTHAEYNRHSAEMKQLNRVVTRNLEVLDTLKPRINQRYAEYQAALKRRQEQRRRESVQSPPTPASDDDLPRQLRSSENTELAARLASQQFAHMQAIRNQVQHRDWRATVEAPSAQPLHVGYSYPAVQQPHRPPTRRPDLFVPPSKPPKPTHEKPAAALSPARPPKAAPAIPSKTSFQTVTEPSYTFAPSAHLENGEPLRTVFLPRTLRTTFLRLAHQNTTANLETCGFLAGTLRANALFVNTLIVPAQTATSDTCEMTNESQLFDYVDSHSLMVMGWIHTHPTQSCFMSSRDLHTHAGYQMMLAESVAVVCAPSKGDTSHGGDWGVFRLTDPPGKTAILRCERPGLFHPHDVDNVYTDAVPGHVMEIEEMEFEIVDLR